MPEDNENNSKDLSTQPLNEQSQDQDNSSTKQSSSKASSKNASKSAKKRRKKKSSKAKSKGSKTSAIAVKAKMPRLFPAIALEEALKIPYAIKQKNGGNPWATDQVANAVGLNVSNTNFFYLAGASVNFGLTIGGWKSERIELTPLGRDIVYAPNLTVERLKKIEAFLNVEVFKKVLDYYKGNNLPEMKYLGNTLESEFGLQPEYHEEFAHLFGENCKYLGVDTGFSDANGNPEVQQALVLASPGTVTLAEPDKGSDLIAFVIMPFGERHDIHPLGFFQEVLRSLITPAARDAGFIVRTANRHGSDVIQSTIVNDLLEADLVIADLTEHNPNVLFELGVRMAIDKPVALIKATDTGPIFDIDNLLRVYPYNSNLWASTIEHDLPNLTNHIKGAWDTRKNENTYMKILRRGIVATSPTTFDVFAKTIRSGTGG